MTLSRKAKLIIAGVVALPILLFVFFTWSSLTWTYSSGTRAGYVQKFSKQGWMCKTWEGELSMVAVPGSTPEKFYFTVRKRLRRQLGQQHVGQTGRPALRAA